MNNYFKLAKEAFLVGFILSIIGILIYFIFQKFFENCNYILIFFVFFISGILFHLICEFSGINKWYCKNGIACNKKLENFTLNNFNPEIINPAYLRE